MFTTIIDLMEGALIKLSKLTKYNAFDKLLLFTMRYRNKYFICSLLDGVEHRLSQRIATAEGAL